MTRSALATFVLLFVALAADARTAARKVHLTLIGDSLAYGAGDESGKGIGGRIEPELRTLGFDSITTTNLGVTGATTKDVLANLEKEKTRAAIERADAIVLSAGANDMRVMFTSEEPVSPVVIAGEVLRNLGTIVEEIRAINEDARILIIGAYLPLANDRAASALGPLIGFWDGMLAAQFADDELVSVVRLSDIVDRPERLSRKDSFHPGGEAYQAAAKRIATMLAE